MNNVSASTKIYYTKDGPIEYTIEFKWYVSTPIGTEIPYTYSISAPNIVWNYVTSVSSAISISGMDPDTNESGGMNIWENGNESSLSGGGHLNGYWANNSLIITKVVIKGTTKNNKTTTLYSSNDVKIYLTEIVNRSL